MRKKGTKLIKGLQTSEMTFEGALLKKCYSRITNYCIIYERGAQWATLK